MNVTTGGQAVTEVDRIQDRISAATEDVFIHLATVITVKFCGHFCLSASTFSVLLLCTLSLHFADMNSQESLYLMYI